jgi:hypothetical protein
LIDDLIRHESTTIMKKVTECQIRTDRNAGYGQVLLTVTGSDASWPARVPGKGHI